MYYDKCYNFCRLLLSVSDEYSITDVHAGREYVGYSCLLVRSPKRERGDAFGGSFLRDDVWGVCQAVAPIMGSRPEPLAVMQNHNLRNLSIRHWERQGWEATPLAWALAKHHFLKKCFNAISLWRLHLRQAMSRMGKIRLRHTCHDYWLGPTGHLCSVVWTVKKLIDTRASPSAVDLLSLILRFLIVVVETL